MPLWDHQIKAVAMLRKYLRNWQPGDGAALVTMPTGTGKSAVIADLVSKVQGARASKHVIVVTPRAWLARQVASDIDTRVWTRIGISRPDTLGRVKIVASAKTFVSEVREEALERTVFITTFSMALEILGQNGVGTQGMTDLFAGFSGVIVDESHYEPAPSWSKAVRAMGLPTCLFTATPFRNDNRMFNLDRAFQYRYSHHEAESDNVLRTPTFHTLERQKNPNAYVASLLNELDKFGDLGGGARVLIRCGTAADVSAVARALDQAGKRVVAVHETFKQKGFPAYLRKVLPAPARLPDVDFYVHQHKLTEGFDDPKIRVLAIYDDFGSDRARVQQIGRCLRNPEHKSAETAHVFSIDDRIETAWERYLRFDRNLGARAVATDPLDPYSLLQSQPDLFYWDRLFREKFDLESEDAWSRIRFRFGTNIRRVPDDFDLDEALLDVERDLKEADRMIMRAFHPVEGTSVFLYVTVRNSPILRDDAFVETELGYAVLHCEAELLLFSSTHGMGERIRRRTMSVEATKISALLNEAATVTSVSLTNNDLSDWAVRSRTLSARNLAEIATEVGDSTYGFATALGRMRVDGKPMQRYTGVKNGRVSDRRGGQGTFEELLAWYAEIKDTIRAAGPPSAALGRYSLPVVPVQPPIAAHVLLDVAGDSFRLEDDDDTPLHIEWSGGEVSSGKFNVTIDDEEVTVAIRWDESTSRFILSSTSLVPYRAIESPDLGVWEYINRHQLIRVATEEGLVYSNRTFWAPKLRLRDNQAGLLSILTSVPSLDRVKEEKGHTIGQDPWQLDTVFGVLESSLLPNALSDDDDATILCTDFGPEIADFIGFDSTNVIFAHAKGQSGGKRTFVSATALHEVVSQAMRSLRFMTIGNEEVPKTGYWTDKWHEGGRGYGPASRLRRGAALASGADYWAAVDRVIQSHAANREVWLVVGRSLSKAALTAALKKESPPPNAVQCHALLTAAWSASQQCGVRLRVFCSE